MGKKITIDPMTRIEGHLKIEVEIEDGKVKIVEYIGAPASIEKVRVIQPPLFF